MHMRCVVHTCGRVIRTGTMDPQFKGCGSLTLLPRHVYGFLRCLALLVPPEADKFGHPTPPSLGDAIVEARCRLVGASVASLLDTAYPFIESFVSHCWCVWPCGAAVR